MKNNNFKHESFLDEGLEEGDQENRLTLIGERKKKKL